MIDERICYLLGSEFGEEVDDDNVETQSLGLAEQDLPPTVTTPSIFTAPNANTHVQARGLMNDDDESAAGKLRKPESKNYLIIFQSRHQSFFR